MGNTDNSENPVLDTYEAYAEPFERLVENNIWNTRYERPAIQSLLHDVSGKYVLDAGCGPGLLAEWLVEQGARVVAVDFTPKMIQLAKIRLGNRVDIRRADLTRKLDFLRDGELDFVVSSLVIDYIRDWDKLFAEFNRILRSDGLLVASIVHPVNDLLKGRTQSYFATEFLYTFWPSLGVEVPGYRRPLQALFDPLCDAGFVLEKLLEPLPLEECKTLDPDTYERLTTTPGFLCIRARKKNRFSSNDDSQ
jgi:SAM-dependent methyltransferase